jgi:hypothetical protein
MILITFAAKTSSNPVTSGHESAISKGVSCPLYLHVIFHNIFFRRNGSRLWKANKRNYGLEAGQWMWKINVKSHIMCRKCKSRGGEGLFFCPTYTNTYTRYFAPTFAPSCWPH